MYRFRPSGVIAVVLSMSSLVVSLPASAEQPIFIQPVAPTVATATAAAPVVAAAKPVEDGYVWPDMTALSHLYWAIGKFQPGDVQAIDSYIMINDCDIYQNYYNNEVEWTKVRAAATQEIHNSLPTFSRQVELMIPIELGRYNDGQNYFEVKDGTTFTKAHRFEFFPNFGVGVCNTRGDVPDYPRGLIVDLDTVLTIEALPVAPDIAQIYMKGGAQNINRERQAYLRLKITVQQHENDLRARDGEMAAEVIARLDGLEVYADAAKTQPLFSMKPSQAREQNEIVMTPDAPNPFKAGASPPASPSLAPPVH